MAAFSVDRVGRRNEVRRTLIFCVQVLVCEQEIWNSQYIIAPLAWPQRDPAGLGCVCAWGIFAFSSFSSGVGCTFAGWWLQIHTYILN